MSDATPPDPADALAATLDVPTPDERREAVRVLGRTAVVFAPPTPAGYVQSAVPHPETAMSAEATSATQQEVRFTPAEFEAFKKGYRAAVIDEVLAAAGRAVADGARTVADGLERMTLPLPTADQRHGADVACRVVAAAMRTAAGALSPPPAATP